VWTRALDRLLSAALVTLVAVLTITVFLQVLVRFIFKAPLPWTEEVTRITFVYAIFVGATIGVRERAHLNVDFVLVYLPDQVRKVLNLVTQALVGVFLVAMVWLGLRYMNGAGVQTTPVLIIPFRYIYGIIPASGAVMLLFLLANIGDDLQKGRAK